MRIVAVDPGGRRLGLAVADDVTGVAVPLRVVPYRGVGNAAAVVAATLREHRAGRVVIGLPTTVDGADSPACARSRALARELERLGVPTSLQPEYLSSREAADRARSTGRRPGQPVDDLAAQVIAEDWLAGRRTGTGARS